MTDKVTTSERFGAWFRAVLARRAVGAVNGDAALWIEREAWLELQGSILAHDVSRCPCIGCDVTRRGQFDSHYAAAVSIERYDALQKRNAS